MSLPERHRQLRVEPLHVGVEARLLARLRDVGLELGLGLVVGLLDPGRVDAAVLEQLLERHAGDLAADAVEAREDDRVGRVVDDEVDAGEVLEGADVAALAADDAALHVVGRQLHHRDRGLGGVARGEPLHDHGQDVADAPVGLPLGLLLDLAHELGAVMADLVLELLEQLVARLGSRHAGHPLELADVALADVVERRGLLTSTRSRSPSSESRPSTASSRARRRSSRRSRSARRSALLPSSVLTAGGGSRGGAAGAGADGRRAACRQPRHPAGEDRRGSHEPDREAQGHHHRGNQDLHDVLFSPWAGWLRPALALSM